MKFLNADKKNQKIINDVGEQIDHLFEQESIQAINAALATRRPLLITGEPGIGKSQLAKAVAAALERVYVSYVVDAQTEAHDLLWQFDAVGRLAEAQVQRSGADKAALAIKQFIKPGPLWWGFDWAGAEQLLRQQQSIATEATEATETAQTVTSNMPKIAEGCDPENGVVVLIDEIDKADSTVPNGLLEALGASRFHPTGFDKPVCNAGEAPLILITSNGERNLPNAFLRRCLSLKLKLPTDDDGFVAFLVKRAKLNYDEFCLPENELDGQSIAKEAAHMLKEDRDYAEQNHLFPLPGQAEYFDLLRGVKTLSESTGQSPKDLIEQLRKFTYQKHIDFAKE